MTEIFCAEDDVLLRVSTGLLATIDKGCRRRRKRKKDENQIRKQFRKASHNRIECPARIPRQLFKKRSFFEGLCKFAHYSKFDECGRLRNRDLVSSANVMCVLSFDRDEDHIAAGGVSKKIKIFDLNAISSDSVDIQYPAEEIYTASVRAVKEETGIDTDLIQVIAFR
ncbi:hypothetical protein JHK86_050388 [Glycine max]|nr:hypothetical protein JHK86_050388 [Glycine max]